MTEMDKQIAVVGGGPAGLAAAEVVAQAGHAVTVYDRMPSLGRKFLMAGRGGLNLTHSEPLPDFLARYYPDQPALRTVIEEFPPSALRAWCGELGEPTFVGSSGRVFPNSFKASPLLRAWLARLANLGVELRPRHCFTGIDRLSCRFSTPDGQLTVSPSAVILALGGASWPRLGSDGGWIPALSGAGVAISPFRPANMGFSIRWSEHFRLRFTGVPVKRVGFRIADRGLLGEAVITEDGIEGGAIYALSRWIRETIEECGEATLFLDLRPDLDVDALASRFARARSGESLATRLRKGAGLAPVAAGLLREAHGLELSDDPKQLASLIKSAPLRLLAPRPIERAISSAGGVRFDALDRRFMLRALLGVFVAGEMLDWEAPTGGYLLQGAIATGRAAAEGALGWLSEP